MLPKVLLAQQLLVGTSFALSSSCIYKDGTVAPQYVPCNTTATEGTCCLQGEACLSSGLCYVSAGLVYRGACIATWDPTKCLTYCDDKSSVFANLYPCTGEGGFGSSAPTFWWCGTDSEETCSTINGTRLQIDPGNAIKILTDDPAPTSELPSSSMASISSTLTLTPIMTSVEARQTGTNDVLKLSCGNNDAKLTTVGVGLGIPLGLLAFVMLGLFLIERRRRMKVENQTIGLTKESESRPSFLTSQVQEPSVRYELTSHSRHELLEGRAELNELGSGF